jgi:hypothetical protein
VILILLIYLMPTGAGGLVRRTADFIGRRMKPRPDR